MMHTLKMARRIAANHGRFVALTLSLGLVACGGGSSDSTGPSPVAPSAQPGWLTLELDTPAANDGAVQFAISGPAIDTVTAVGYNGTSAVTPTSAQLVVTGAVTDGAVARIFVKDLRKANEYRAWIVAAAARGTYQLQATDGYRAVLVR